MDDQWYWDLKQKKAVQGLNRGPDSQVLGPYATKHDAENWQEQVEANNQAWDDDDEEWSEWGDTSDDDASTPSTANVDPNVTADNPYTIDRDSSDPA